MKTSTNKTTRFGLTKTQSDIENVKIQSSKDAYNYIKQFYLDDVDIYESFFIAILDRSNSTVGYAKISQGGIVGTVVDVKIIAKYCIDSLASSVILAHNHPSGNRNPSKADENITHKISNALKLIDVQVLDHLIITRDGYFSFADEGISITK